MEILINYYNDLHYFETENLDYGINTNFGCEKIFYNKKIQFVYLLHNTYENKQLLRVPKSLQGKDTFSHNLNYENNIALRGVLTKIWEWVSLDASGFSVWERRDFVMKELMGCETYLRFTLGCLFTLCCLFRYIHILSGRFGSYYWKWEAGEYQELAISLAESSYFFFILRWWDAKQRWRAKFIIPQKIRLLIVEPLFSDVFVLAWIGVFFINSFSVL